MQNSMQMEGFITFLKKYYPKISHPEKTLGFIRYSAKHNLEIGIIDLETSKKTLTDYSNLLVRHFTIIGRANPKSNAATYTSYMRYYLEYLRQKSAGTEQYPSSKIRSEGTSVDSHEPHGVKLDHSSIEVDIASVWKFYGKLLADENDRYRSWEHCFQYFKENRKNENVNELLCLHLGFYLASWGMFRGGAFLMQKDYFVHTDVVKLLSQERYDPLFGITSDQLTSPNISLMMELKKKITDLYRLRTTIVMGKSGEGKTATDTLITKILMGTLGCTPAYDRYFVSGLKELGFKYTKFTKTSMQEIGIFCQQHKDQLDELLEKINSESKVKYPSMKVIDMFFWQVGYDKFNS